MASLKVKARSGVGAVKPGGPRVVVASSLPRTVRNRSPRRKQVLKPGSPHERPEQVQNPLTGRTASGPWRGPFAAAAAESGVSDVLLPTTIFMDAAGGCHLAMDRRTDLRMSQELAKAQSDSGLLSEAADAAVGQLDAAVMERRFEVHAQARARQAHSRMEHAARDKMPAARNVAMHASKVINQPRRFN